jgi:2-deoxy-D-gluconate 3-dehydrogenase
MNYASTDNKAQFRANPDRNASVLARIPANRWGTPEDLTRALVFLSAPASVYVMGIIVTVDGSWMGRKLYFKFKASFVSNY